MDLGSRADRPDSAYPDAQYQGGGHATAPGGGVAAPDWLPRTDDLIDPFGSVPDAPPPAPPRRSRAAVAIIAVLSAVLLLAAAIAVGEWAARTAEMDDLVDGIETSEAAMVGAMEQVRATVGGAVGMAPGTDEAAGELTRIAGAARGQIAAAAAAIAAVPVQPWHEDVSAARDAYLAHSSAWQDYLTRAEQEPSVWFEQDAQIESTWIALGPILSAAVPTPAILDLDVRVERILDDGSNSDGGSGDTVRT